MKLIPSERKQRTRSPRSKTCSLTRTTIPNNSPSVLPSQEPSHTNKEPRNLKEFAWKLCSTTDFYKLFHTLLYGGLTVTCAVEALHTGSVPIQLMGLWTAAAAQIGVPTAKDAFASFAETIAHKDTRKKPRQPKAE